MSELSSPPITLAVLVKKHFFFSDKPHNPMVNSGAIMSASILLYQVKPEMNVAQKYDYVFDFFKVRSWKEAFESMTFYCRHTWIWVEI
jgi:glutaminase